MTRIIELQSVDAEQIAASAQRQLVVAQSIEIDGPEMYEEAGQTLVRITARIKELDEQRKAITRPLDEAKQNVMALFKPATERLEQAQLVLRRAIGSYDEQQRAERARLQREAEAAAEAERRRLREEAAKAEQAGDSERAAEATIAQAMLVAPAAPPVQKVSGISTRQAWSAEVTDLHALVKHVAANPDLIHLLLPNDTALRQMATALKDALKLPGVRAVPKSIVAARGAR